MIPGRRLAKMAWIARARLRRKWLALREDLAVRFTPVPKEQQFCVVSCERNAGPAAIRCLDSVYRQRYPRARVRHVFIDDASTDDTNPLVRNWLAGHPGHRVEYLHQKVRRGGTANTLLGMRMARPGEIVIELNGDDWLAGHGVFAFLSRVYADPDVWMTFNTLRYLNGLPALWARPVPEEITAANAYREMDEWVSSAPHTFRSELFGHVREETLIDPETGEYWESADDQAIYLAMMELAGRHSRHLHRVMYVYNFREDSHCFAGSTLSQGRAQRIRRQPRYLPLERL